MNNLLAGTGIGTVFVDHQLGIQRFTPAVTQVINLILTDVGRPWVISSPTSPTTTAWWKMCGRCWTSWFPKRWKCGPHRVHGICCGSARIAPRKT